MYKCPHCYINAKTIHGLKKHLSGTFNYGGHQLSENEINLIISNISNSGYKPVLKNSFKNSSITINKPTDFYGVFIYDLFLSLLKNKDIPKYQFERRIDTIFELFLPDYLSQLYKGVVEFVVPEFPLKKDSNNQSTNIDYLFFLTIENGENKWIMLELKTDMDSVKTEQLEIYCNSIQKGMKRIIEDLIVIRNNSSKKHKYNILIERIENFKSDCPLEVIYLSPNKTGLESNNPEIKFITFAELIDFKPKKYEEVWELFREILIKNI